MHAWKPASRPQSNLVQRGKGVSEAMGPKVKPNQVLLPNFHGWKVKYGEIYSKKENFYTLVQDIVNATGHTLGDD